MPYHEEDKPTAVRRHNRLGDSLRRDARVGRHVVMYCGIAESNRNWG